MRIDIKNAVVHTPLFILGTNHGEKLGTKFPVTMQYDTQLMCLLVKYRGQVALVPHASVASMDVANVTDIYPLAVGSNQSETNGFKPSSSESPVCQTQIVAQVENPTLPKQGRTRAA